MRPSNLNLAALIGSRICHDLISPIGAINNGLELLGMAAPTEGPEFELISQSVGNASARIRFFRIAYGAASVQLVGRAEIVSILADVMGGGRLEVAWVPLDGQPRTLVRLAFLALQCLENAMPYGGRIEVTCDQGRWTLHGHSKKLNIDDVLWSMLDPTASVDAAADIAPAHVQFALLPAFAEEAGCNVATDRSDTNISITF